MRFPTWKPGLWITRTDWLRKTILNMNTELSPRTLDAINPIFEHWQFIYDYCYYYYLLLWVTGLQGFILPAYPSLLDNIHNNVCMIICFGGMMETSHLLLVILELHIYLLVGWNKTVNDDLNYKLNVRYVLVSCFIFRIALEFGISCYDDTHSVLHALIRSITVLHWERWWATVTSERAVYFTLVALVRFLFRIAIIAKANCITKEQDKMIKRTFLVFFYPTTFYTWGKGSHMIWWDN